MEHDFESDALIEQVVQFGVLYYILPDGLVDVSEDDLEQIHAVNNYSVINLVERLESHNIKNDTNLFPEFENMVCDPDGFGVYRFISEFAIDVVAEVLNINIEEYELLVLVFLDKEENERKITINDFVELAKQIKGSYNGVSEN